MKVVNVEYRGRSRNVFLYDGMSSSEVAALLSACAVNPNGGAPPKILALRDPVSGTVVPFSLALKHLPSLWPRFQLLDQRDIEQTPKGPALNINANKNDNYKRPQSAAASSGGAGVGSSRLGSFDSSSVRPSSAAVGGAQSAFNRSLAGVPTPIARNGATANQYNTQATRVNNYMNGTSSSSASSSSVVNPKYNFVGSGYDSSPLASSSASSPSYSPRFAAVASPTSSIASSIWNDPANNSGIHVVLSYSELLNILTGHVPPNINNGPTPPALYQRDHMFALAVVVAGSQECEDRFLDFQRFASGNRFSNLIFLIMEAELLIGSTLEVEIDQVPSFQFFLRGHLLGQLNRPTVKQLESILTSSNRLVEENPDIRIEDGIEVDEEEDEEDEEEEYAQSSEAESSGADDYDESNWRAAAQRAAEDDSKSTRNRVGQTNRGSFSTSRAQSLGMVLDSNYAPLSEQERREVFQNAVDEEARWAQLLQSSPRSSPQKKKRTVWRPSPDASEDEGVELPPTAGLVIRGQKVQIHKPTTQQQQQQQQPRRGQLRDTLDYEQFDVADSVDESDYGGGSSEGSDPDYSDSNPSDSDGDVDVGPTDTSYSRKRKSHPSASSEDEDDPADSEAGGVGVADGGSDYSQALSLSPRDRSSANSSALASLTASPALAPRLAPNGVGSDSSNTGIVMSSTEAKAIERLILRQDPDVKAAFNVCPDLDSMLEVFVRMVSFQLANPTPTNNSMVNNKKQVVASASAPQNAAAAGASPTRKRKENPVPLLVCQEPRHKRLLAESYKLAQAAAAAARARHKRMNEQVYASASPSVQASPSASDDDDDDADVPTARERQALDNLSKQQAKYAALQEQYVAIQSEIFSKTIHDLAGQGLLTPEEHGYLVHLWTGTESGSKAILDRIKSYEQDGDEIAFMQSLIQLARKFASGQGVGEESPTQSEEEAEDDDDDGEDEQPESPLPSDEERQYQSLLREFEREHGLAPGSVGAEGDADFSASPTDSDAGSPQPSPIRPPQSSTKAPRPSPATGAPPTNKEQADKYEQQQQAAGDLKDSSDEFEDEEEREARILDSSLDVLSQMVSLGYLESQEGHRAKQYLSHGHPLLQAAFLAFDYNEDVEDLADTIKQVLQTATESKHATPNKTQQAQTTTSSPAAATATASKPSAAALRSSFQLLNVMPPWIVSDRSSELESLYSSGDATLFAAWSVLQNLVESRAHAKELALAIEDFIETIVRRIDTIKQQKEKEEKEQHSNKSAVESTSTSSASDVSGSIADALQITSVLHTGNVFSDEETALLWTLILRKNFVILAAFDIAREDEQWDETHDTLIRLLSRHSSLEPVSRQLLPMVRSSSGSMSSDDIARMQQMVSQEQPQPATQSASTTETPARTRALPPPATPISPSIPQTGWSRVVRAFTAALETLQGEGLDDPAALRLIELFQAKSPAIVAAAEVLELDGNQAEFVDTLRVIAQEEEEHAANGSKKSSDSHAKPSEQASNDARKAERDRLVQSFAERVQAVDDIEQAGEYDEEEEEDQQEEDDDDADSLDELLAKDENDDWDEASIDQLYHKVQLMQNELHRLKIAQIEKGFTVEDEDEDEDEEDAWNLEEREDGEEEGEEEEEEEEEEKEQGKDQ